jgi:hypothetical protein
MPIRPPRVSGAVARRLLDGGHGPSPLPELLAAARAPATAAELRTEPAARAAFRSSVHPDASPLPHDIPRRIPMRTTTTIMVAKAIAAIALTASTAGGVALATHSSPTTPRDKSSSTTAKAAASDALAADLTSLTTAPSTALADDHARPDTPVGPARDGEENGKATTDRASASAAHPTGRCQALSNISGTAQPGKAADSPAFADLSCSDNGTATAKHTGRPTAPPGNPDQRTGKPDTDRDENARGDTEADKQADNRQR